ncbi:alkaline phosphatase family protein [Sporosarcina obsidiansis]|uniref:alkaline phosphatase family protein n=1 Tax=Sporosarcina obsidiansis TaxID=2660748 RepID=UPI00129B4C0B|nr:alkaline phosphatase family protein [Sporosarcina obsidiansis]
MKKRMMVFMVIILISLLADGMNRSASAMETEGTISVVSFDGLGYMDAQRYIEKGIMPNLKAYEKKAAYATDFVTVMPSLTAPSHAAMATGANPAETGIVSNEFHSAGEKVKEGQSGFSQTLGVTPIWKEAENQGKVTATVAFPESNPDNASAATYAVYSGGTLAESKLHDLEFSPIDDERVDELSSGHLAVQEAVVSLHIKNAPSQELYVLVTDENEPAIYLSTDQKKVGQQVEWKDWQAVSLDVPSMDSTGFYVKFKGNPQNLDELQLFQGTVMGGIYRGPENFTDEIYSEFGFYPAPDETAAFKKGEITREEYEQAGERFIDWVTNVSLYIKERYTPDLLIYYYPHIDNELHEFMLRDPAQPGYTVGNVLEKETYVSWAFKQADRTIGRITSDLNRNDHLLLVSDHGMDPIHTRISPNKELEKAGLLTTDNEGKIIVSKTKAYAEASGTIAHVYVNLKGREKKGIVEPEEFENVKQQVMKVFTNSKIFSNLSKKPSRGGEPILQWLTGRNTFAYSYPSAKFLLENKKVILQPYEQVLTPEMLAYADMSNENSGDVFLMAAPGYLMGKDAEIAIEPTEELGSHGGDPERQTLRPIFYASGPMIKSGELRDRISMIDIAPSIYKLLGLQAPHFVQGRSVW